jgi:putative oxidoreductase
MDSRIAKLVEWTLRFARLALAAAFLSAVADRLGLWGPLETPGVDWGSMPRFYADVAALNPWLPEAMIPALAWFVTIVEAILGVLLITGPYVRASAFASGVLLLAFAIAMTLFLGPKLPLNYSVFTAAACAFLVAFVPPKAG